jgi:hypothetical protein
MVGSSGSSRARTLAVAALGPALALSLVACGGGSSSGSTSAAAAPTVTATGAPGTNDGARGGANGAEFQKIQACLKAAGIAVPTRSPGPRPTGSTGYRQNGTPNGTPPSGGVRPSGGGFGGNGGGMFTSAAAQAAIKACGLTVPTFGGRPRATAG